MTTVSNQAEAAGRIIHRCWTNGDVIEALPDECRPRTMADGYAAQRALAAVSGEPVLGWKIAATSTSGQRHINVDGPIAGRLLASRVHHGPCEVAFGANRMAVAEAEFAFVMGAELPAREKAYSVEEVLAAVATLHPAIEIPDSRFADFTRAGSAQLAADNACAHEFVLGPATGADWRAIDLAAQPVRLSIDGRVATTGAGADALGDPRIALAWIANNHAAQGAALQAGDIITTGVCGKPGAIAAGSRVEADLGPIGTAEVTLA